MAIEYIQVSTTTEKKEDAERIARLLVEMRLAACVQISGPIRSTYWWKGRIETVEEWLCLAKTGRHLLPEIERVIAREHPYETPELVATSITGGSETYLRWLAAEILPAAG